MTIKLSDHFAYGKLLRFTFPSIAMMIFTSIYGVVDGFFVSNYVGNTPFAALNLIMPFIMVMTAIGFMFGTGGSALVAYTLGTGDKKGANEVFSLIIYLLIVIGLICSIIGFVFAKPVSLMLGATDAMLPYCVSYAKVCSLGMAPFMLQNAFQSFTVVAERPKLGLYVTIVAGVTNMFFDWLFMGIFRLGIKSAAAATVLGVIVGGGLPFFYFLKKNTSLLQLCKPSKNSCHERLLRILDQHIRLRSKHAVQFSAPQICRRVRRFCIWNNHVYQFHFPWGLLWICTRSISDNRLSLWHGGKERIKECLFKEPRTHFCCFNHNGSDRRTARKATRNDICKL